MTSPHLFYGLDLGQRSTPSALALLERIQILTGRFDPVHFEHERRTILFLRHLERLPLGLPYLDVVSRVARLIRLPSPVHENPRKTLAVDATGVGAPVVELLQRARLNAAVVPITITSGSDVSSDNSGGYRIPRCELLTNLRLLFESRLLRIPQSLPLCSDLAGELRRLTGQKSAASDDLALALALAAWPARLRIPLPAEPVSALG